MFVESEAEHHQSHVDIILLAEHIVSRRVTLPPRGDRVYLTNEITRAVPSTLPMLTAYQYIFFSELSTCTHLIPVFRPSWRKVRRSQLFDESEIPAVRHTNNVCVSYKNIIIHVTNSGCVREPTVILMRPECLVDTTLGSVAAKASRRLLAVAGDEPRAPCRSYYALNVGESEWE